MPKTDQQKAEKLYLEGGSSYSILAKKFKVSERTVKRWAEVGNWQAKKKSLETVSTSVAAKIQDELQEPVRPVTVRAHFKDEPIELRQLYQSAVAYLHSAYPEAEIKSAEAAIATIAKIGQAMHQLDLAEIEKEQKQVELELKKADLELKRRQLNPPELDGLIEMILGFGYTPKEMAEILRRKLGK